MEFRSWQHKCKFSWFYSELWVVQDIFFFLISTGYHPLKCRTYYFFLSQVEDFTERSQNVARSVGKVEVQKIYQCIHLSLQHISSFIKGHIQAPMLKELLFGPDAFTPEEVASNNPKVNLRRISSLNDSAAPLNPTPVKRLRHTEAVAENRGCNAWSKAVLSTSVHPSSNHPQWGNGLWPQIAAQATPNGFEWSNSLDPTDQMLYNGLGQTPNRCNSGWPAWTQQHQRTPIVFDGSYSRNPMAQMPNKGVGQSPTGYSNNAGELQHKVLHPLGFEQMHGRDPTFQMHSDGTGCTPQACTTTFLDLKGCSVHRKYSTLQ